MKGLGVRHSVTKVEVYDKAVVIVDHEGGSNNFFIIYKLVNFYTKLAFDLFYVYGGQYTDTTFGTGIKLSIYNKVEFGTNPTVTDCYNGTKVYTSAGWCMEDGSSISRSGNVITIKKSDGTELIYRTSGSAGYIYPKEIKYPTGEKLVITENSDTIVIELKVNVKNTDNTITEELIEEIVVSFSAINKTVCHYVNNSVKYSAHPVYSSTGLITGISYKYSGVINDTLGIEYQNGIKITDSLACYRVKIVSDTSSVVSGVYSYDIDSTGEEKLINTKTYSYDSGHTTVTDDGIGHTIYYNSLGFLSEESAVAKTQYKDNLIGCLKIDSNNKVKASGIKRYYKRSDVEQYSLVKNGFSTAGISYFSTNNGVTEQSAVAVFDLERITIFRLSGNDYFRQEISIKGEAYEVFTLGFGANLRNSSSSLTASVKYYNESNVEISGYSELITISNVTTDTYFYYNVLSYPIVPFSKIAIKLETTTEGSLVEIYGINLIRGAYGSVNYYNSDGKLSETISNNENYTYGYDSLKRLINVASDSVESTNYTYSDNSFLVSKQESNRGSKEEYTYQDYEAYTSNNVRYIKKTNKVTTTTCVRDSVKPYDKEVTYDGFGRETLNKSYSGMATTISYTNSNNLFKVVSPNGIAKEYDYNSYIDLENVTLKDSETAVDKTTYFYNADRTVSKFGKYNLATSPNRRLEFAYDIYKNVVYVGTTDSNTSQALEVYTYDSVNPSLLTGIKYYNVTNGITYSYDSYKKITGINDMFNSYQIGYNSTNRVSSITGGNQQTNYSYDCFGKVKSVSKGLFEIKYSNGLRQRELIKTYTYDVEGLVANHLGDYSHILNISQYIKYIKSRNYTETNKIYTAFFESIGTNNYMNNSLSCYVSGVKSEIAASRDDTATLAIGEVFVKEISQTRVYNYVVPSTASDKSAFMWIKKDSISNVTSLNLIELSKRNEGYYYRLVYNPSSGKMNLVIKALNNFNRTEEIDYIFTDTNYAHIGLTVTYGYDDPDDGGVGDYTEITVYINGRSYYFMYDNPHCYVALYDDYNYKIGGSDGFLGSYYVTGLTTVPNKCLSTSEVEALYKEGKLFIGISDSNIPFLTSSNQTRFYNTNSNIEYFPLSSSTENLSGNITASYISRVDISIYNRCEMFAYVGYGERPMMVSNSNIVRYDLAYSSTMCFGLNILFNSKTNLQSFFGLKIGSYQIKFSRDNARKLIINVNGATLTTNITNVLDDTMYRVGICYNALESKIYLKVNGTESNYTVSTMPSSGNLEIYLGSIFSNEAMNGFISDFAYSINQSNFGLVYSYNELAGIKYLVEENGFNKQVVYGGSNYQHKYSEDTNNGKLTGRVSQEIIGSETYNYTYDSLNRIKYITGSKNVTYTYNNKNELTGAVIDNVTYNYVYDSYGNITTYTKTEGGSTVTKTFNYGISHWCDKLTSVNNVNVEYDSSYVGYVKVVGTIPLTITNNKLVGAQVNNNNYTYAYSYNGLRSSKSINNTIQSTYYYENNQLVFELRGDIKIYYLYNTFNDIIGYRKNNDYYYYVKDILGVINKIIDSNGNVVGTYSYTPYGELITTSGTEATFNSIRYKSYYYDVETNLYYCNTRYYNPEWGRWISPDTSDYLDSESTIGLNLYAYCGNNPVNYVDPSGHFPILALLCGIALVGMGLTIGGVASDNNTLTAVGLTMVAVPALISGGLAIAAGVGGATLTGIVGGVTVAAGVGSGLFASAEYQEAAGYGNWIQDSTGMSDGIYNTLLLSTAAIATLGTAASSVGYSFRIKSITNFGSLEGTKYKGIKFEQISSNGKVRLRSLEWHNHLHNGHYHWQLNKWDGIIRKGAAGRWTWWLGKL